MVPCPESRGCSSESNSNIDRGMRKISQYDQGLTDHRGYTVHRCTGDSILGRREKFENTAGLPYLPTMILPDRQI